MTRVEVDPGVCGFITQISVDSRPDGQVAVSIETDCGLVQAWAPSIAVVDPLVSVGAPGRRLPVCEQCHAACPVPVGVLKAIEVEAGFNLPRPASIRFLPREG